MEQLSAVRISADKWRASLGILSIAYFRGQAALVANALRGVVRKRLFSILHSRYADFCAQIAVEFSEAIHIDTVLPLRAR
jgi:hypothetical protein